MTVVSMWGKTRSIRLEVDGNLSIDELKNIINEKMEIGAAKMTLEKEVFSPLNPLLWLVSLSLFLLDFSLPLSLSSVSLCLSFILCQEVV